MSVVPSKVPHQGSLVAEPETGFLGMIERLALHPDLPVEKLEKLLDMQIRVRAIEAEQAFSSAMAKVQAELPTIVRDSPNTQTNSKYAKHEKIAKAIKPIYTREGFSITFSEGDTPKEKHIRIVGILRHSAGHKETHFIDVAIDDVGIQGKVNKTQTHAEASSGTYGRRLLTCLMFDVALGNDNDGNHQSLPTITESQVADLESLMQEIGITGQRRDTMLKALKITSLDQILAKNYEAVVKQVEAKRK